MSHRYIWSAQGGQHFLAGRVRIPRTGMADARQHSELVFSEAGPS